MIWLVLVAHILCVYICTIHQNVKLMKVGVKLPDLASRVDLTLSTYHHCISQVICNPQLPQCYLGACSSCPGMDYLKASLQSILDENIVDSVTYKQWTNTDRSTLETIAAQPMNLWKHFAKN